MKRQRVLIIRNAYQQDTGGAEQYAFNLAVALKNAGHFPFLVTKHQAIRRKCNAENIRFIHGYWDESQEWSKGYYLRYLLASLWYCWLIIRYRITVVNPQSRDDFVFATNAGSLLRKTVIWTDHADLKYILDRVNHRHPRMQSWILKAASKARIIVCVSSSEKDLIRSVAPELETKLTIIHNGVFRPENVQPIDKKDMFVIGTNARLVPEKGIGELIDAFAAVSKKHTGLELWLLGGLSNNKELYEGKVEKLNLSDKVKLLGYMPNPNDYVASMDIFVHASYHEGFSLAIIEACMLGRPIIATAVGGTPEIIDKMSGILVEPKNPEAIAAALEKLINDGALRIKLAQNAQELAEKEFDFQKIVENKLIPLYEGAKT